MSGTRRVKDGARRTQNGWASAVEYEDLRGLNGSAVAFKANLVGDPKKKELLFFLQALSLREGGIKRIAREVIEMFPERIGTPTMIEIGCQPGKRLTQEQRDKIHEEIHGADIGSILRFNENSEPCKSTAEEFYNSCRERIENDLDEFIERLCCDPKLSVTDDWDGHSHYRRIVEIILEDMEDSDSQCPASRGGFDIAHLNCFHNVLGALFEYQRRHQQRVRDDFADTSISKVIFEAMDYAVETGRSAYIEGDSGFGKTTALEAWCSIHSGRARLVKLKGITHRTGFFREVARALGIARGTGLSPGKVQLRVEQFLQRTKILLAIDEGQYLFPAGNRVYTPPELINWLMTACYNEGVPFVISATSEFTDRRAVVEKNTTWQSEQLRRRIRRYFALPKVPTKDDLRSVATKLLPDAAPEMIDYVVGYSLASKGFFQAITNAIEDARLIARRAGRDGIKFADLKSAIQDWRSPTDAQLQRIFEDKPKSGHRSRAAGESAAQSAPQFDAVETPLNRVLRPVNKSDHRSDLLTPA